MVVYKGGPNNLSRATLARCEKNTETVMVVTWQVEKDKSAKRRQGYKREMCRIGLLVRLDLLVRILEGSTGP